MLKATSWFGHENPCERVTWTKCQQQHDILDDVIYCLVSHGLFQLSKSRWTEPDWKETFST